MRHPLDVQFETSHFGSPLDIQEISMAHWGYGFPKFILIFLSDFKPILLKTIAEERFINITN